MMGGDHHEPAGAQDPVDLPQSADPVVDMVDDEGEQGAVDAGVLQPVERLAEAVHPEVGPGRRSAAGEAHHVGAGIEADERGPPCDHRLGVEARATAGVEDGETVDVAQQVEHRRAVVQGVVGPRLGVALEVLGEGSPVAGQVAAPSHVGRGAFMTRRAAGEVGAPWAGCGGAGARRGGRLWPPRLARWPG
jgi:hypothetical protein